MKIYINGRYLTQEITGVQRYSHELVRCIDEAHGSSGSMEVILLAPPSGLRFHPPVRHIRFEQVGTHSGHLWEQVDLPRYSADGVLFCPGNAAPVASLARGFPTVVTVHDLSYKYFPEAYSWRFRAVYNALMPLVVKNASRIITVSKSELEAICSHYPQARPRIVAIQNGGFGLDIDPRIASIPAKTLGFPYGLYVGSLSKRKNFPALLQAAIQLARSTNTGFVFVGGIQASLQISSTDVPADVRDRIVFAGQVDDATELVSWYKGARFMAFPSLYEASPFPPIEAMRCGCPVLASSIPSLTERCGDAALYCDPSSERDISDALIRLATDDQLRADLARRGRERAASYSWTECASSTLKILRQVGDLVVSRRNQLVSRS